MALWNIEHFTPKEFENKAEAGRLLWPSPATSFLPLKQLIKLSCEGCPPHAQWKGASLSWKTKWCEKGLNKQARFPWFATLTSETLTCCISTWLSSSHLTKILWFNYFFRVPIFLWNLLCQGKLILSKFVSFLFLVCLCQFKFQMQPGALRRSGTAPPSLSWTPSTRGPSLPPTLPLTKASSLLCLLCWGSTKCTFGTKKPHPLYYVNSRCQIPGWVQVWSKSRLS